VTPAELFRRVEKVKEGIEGITLSGGEPLDQIPGLLCFLRLVRERTSLSVLLFTGYTREEAESLPGGREVLKLVDVVVTGPYIRSLHLGHGLLGSTNQRVEFLSARYAPEDLEAVPEAEVLIDRDGAVVVTGIEGGRVREALLPVGGGSA
jgi:anaerobic ribonucleoside-triphosphate reductase activating protein